MLTLKKSAMKYKDANGVMQDVGAMCSVNETDTTLTKSGVAADAKISGDKITDLDNKVKTNTARIDVFTSLPEGATVGDAELEDAKVDFEGNVYTNVGEHIRTVTGQLSNEIGDVINTEDMFLNPSTNLIKKHEIVDGKYKQPNGEDNENINYFYTGKINVIDIDRIVSPVGIRFITAYNNDDIVETAGVNNTSYEYTYFYTIPDGITHIVASFNKTVAPINNAILYEYKGILYNKLPRYRTIKRESLNDGKSSTNKLIIPDVMSGNVFELDENHIHKNKQINFYCEIDGEFRDIRVGHGRRIYNGNYIQITPNEYIVFGYQNADIEVVKGVHGLNIKDFISISITCNADKKASILVVTNGGTFELNDIEWTGNNGKPFVNWWSDVTPLPTLSNGILEFNSFDYSKPIYAFGDSYLNTWANDRYPYYVKSKGIDTWLIDGFPGRNSAMAIESFRNIMKKGNPKYILWLLGMNDDDTDGDLNSSWKACVDEVVEYCIEHNIEPILATIPCIPTVRNDRKNAYVKNLGYRYIDFAKAVGGETIGSSWYSGFLSTDNVHPTVQGAKALANRLFLDFPEIINQN